jgi:hypothetical protein
MRRGGGKAKKDLWSNVGGCCSSQRLTVWQSRKELLNLSFRNFGLKTIHQAATELETNGEIDDDTVLV